MVFTVSRIAYWVYKMFIMKAILRVIMQGRNQEETTVETKDPKGVARAPKARERPTKAGVFRGVGGMPPPPRNFEIQTLGNAISSVLMAFW